MVARVKANRAQQVRLAPDEDDATIKLASVRGVSKNDLIRQALRLLLKIDREVSRGARLELRRAGASEVVEVWIV